METSTKHSLSFLSKSASCAAIMAAAWTATASAQPLSARVARQRRVRHFCAIVDCPSESGEVRVSVRATKRAKRTRNGRRKLRRRCSRKVESVLRRCLAPEQTPESSPTPMSPPSQPVSPPQPQPQPQPQPNPTIDPSPAPAPPSGTQITLPIEVLGDNDIESITLTFNNSVPDRIRLQVHRPAYGTQAQSAKMSVRINQSSWLDVLDSSVVVAPKAAAYGGLGGGFKTVSFTMDASALVAGANTLSFRFNGSDGKTIGYRVIGIQPLLGPTKVDPLETLTEVNPVDLSSLQQGTIEEGRTLWQTATLRKSSLDTTLIRATCGDCHAQDGRDLQYYAYSNKAIVERAKFHGLSETQGHSIARYIRSLDVPSYGRPWNPPYQPGNGTDSRGADWWAAGASIDAVVQDDRAMAADMLSLPSSTTQTVTRANQLFNADDTLNLRETPLSIQLPDWNSWLPEVHPVDAWQQQYFENGRAARAYRTLRNELSGNTNKGGIPGILRSWDLSYILGLFTTETRQWLATGKTASVQNSPSAWRTSRGTVLDASTHPQKELVRRSLAQWLAVKYWEVMHEFNLEGIAAQIPQVPAPEPLSWPANRQTVHPIAPHITSDNLLSFTGQPEVVGLYESSAWYQLQMILNAGMRQPADVQPVDWPYQLNHIRKLGERSGLQEPMRYLQSYAKMLQVRHNGVGPSLRGWTLRNLHPWRLYGAPSGDTSLFDTLNSYLPGLRGILTGAAISEFTRVTSSFNLQQWPRIQQGDPGFDYWYKLQPRGYRPTTNNHRNGQLFSNPQNRHADDFARLLPKLSAAGVEQEVIEDLANWCSDAWPNYEW